MQCFVFALFFEKGLTVAHGGIEHARFSGIDLGSALIVVVSSSPILKRLKYERDAFVENELVFLDTETKRRHEFVKMLFF